MANLEAAILKLEKTKDDQGRPMHIRAKRLWIPPDLRWTAQTILLGRALELPGTGNRDINPLAGRLEIVECPYLTSTTAWFVQGDQQKVLFFNRVPLTYGRDTEFKTGCDLIKATYACSIGAGDWRGWVGSTGL